MKFLAGLLFHNFVYKLIAVLVAAVLWAAVQGSRSVEESLDLPIELPHGPASAKRLRLVETAGSLRLDRQQSNVR